jgi:hypothetical protein
MVIRIRVLPFLLIYMAQQLISVKNSEHITLLISIGASIGCRVRLLVHGTFFAGKLFAG